MKPGKSKQETIIQRNNAEKSWGDQWVDIQRTEKLLEIKCVDMKKKDGNRDQNILNLDYENNISYL